MVLAVKNKLYRSSLSPAEAGRCQEGFFFFLMHIFVLSDAVFIK